MTKMQRCCVVLLLALFGVTFAPSVMAQAQLKDFVRVIEVISSKSERPLPEKGVMDRRSNIRITFDNGSLKSKLSEPGKAVEIRITASILRKNGDETQIDVPNYSTIVRTKAEDGSAGTEKTEPKYHDKLVENVGGTFPGAGFLPDTSIDLTRQKLEPGDRLSITIRNKKTAEFLPYTVTADDYGLNQKVADSFFLLRRLGVTTKDEADGEKNVNFGPAPGVMFGWVYSARENAFMRFLKPGFGYNVSFTDWNDPAFDVGTGKFAAGTDANKIEVTTGPVVTLFDNTLQFTYGWNLNVQKDRRYFGIGFSFFKLTEKIGSLIDTKK